MERKILGGGGSSVHLVCNLGDTMSSRSFSTFMGCLRWYSIVCECLKMFFSWL